MKYLEILDPKDGLIGVYKKFPDVAESFTPLLETVMRNESSQLSLGERELIALYVSVLNKCGYCIKIHSESAKALGIRTALVDELREEETFSNAEDKLKPILQLVQKIVTDVKNISKSDYDAAKKGGWNEETLVSLLCVVSVYNMINTLVSSLDLEIDEKEAKQTGGFIAKAGYLPILEMIKASR